MIKSMTRQPTLGVHRGQEDHFTQLEPHPHVIRLDAGLSFSVGSPCRTRISLLTSCGAFWRGNKVAMQPHISSRVGIHPMRRQAEIRSATTHWTLSGFFWWGVNLPVTGEWQRRKRKVNNVSLQFWGLTWESNTIMGKMLSCPIKMIIISGLSKINR